MICKNDLKNVMSTLLNKEVDTDIILNEISGYFNKSKEFFASLLTFKVIQGTSSEGSICKGIINVGDEFLWVNLDCAIEGNEHKYILTAI